MTTTSEVRQRLQAFVAEREWNRFHTPKNLAVGLSIEAAELLELFLWLTDEECVNLDATRLAKVRDELGDVQLYLINLADRYGLDPLDCALLKLRANEQKYPAAKVRGSARKYDEY